MELSGIDLPAVCFVALRRDPTCLDGAQDGRAIDAGGGRGRDEVVHERCSARLRDVASDVASGWLTGS